MKIRSGIYVKEENSTRFTSPEEHQISLNDGNSIQICINEVNLLQQRKFKEIEGNLNQIYFNKGNPRKSREILIKFTSTKEI